MYVYTSTYPPNGIHLLGVQLEVLLCELDGRHGAETQVRPAADELQHRLKCVQRQAVVAIVGHVRHEHVYLGITNFKSVFL